MTVLAVNLGNRAREVAVPGKGAAVGAHECVPGVCTVSHYFANVFVCRMTGCHHVCDRTCRYRQLAEGGTSCRLSGKFFLWEEQSILGKAQRNCEIEPRGSKRSRDSLDEDMDC